LIVRTPRGRRLTAKGDEHLGAPPKAGQGKLF
jgi:Holliday junction resolvasome RuvABC ATP-dependent DNA helicase subunit